MPRLGAGRMIKIASILTLDQLLDIAREYIPEAWIIGESPQAIIFGPMREYGYARNLLACERITLFDKIYEMRMEKPSGADSGKCFCVKPAGDMSEFAIRQLLRILRK